jgi:hypothetical protein
MKAVQVKIIRLIYKAAICLPFSVLNCVGISVVTLQIVEIETSLLSVHLE